MATSSIRSGGERGVAPQQLADHLDDEVVGAGVGIAATSLAERSAYAVDEDDLVRAADGSADHRTSKSEQSPRCYWSVGEGQPRCLVASRIDSGLSSSACSATNAPTQSGSVRA